MFNTLLHRALRRGLMPCARSGFLLLFLGVLVASANAQSDSQRLSLERAISLTLAENPQLHQFLVKKRGLLGLREYSNLSPALSVGVDVENFAGSNTNTGIDAAEFTLSLSSVIEFGSKRSARVSVADARLNVLEYQKQAFTLDVLGELTTVFVKTLEVEAFLALAKEARDLSRSTLAIVRNRSSRGAAPESEVKRATAAAAQAQLHLDALQQQHERYQIKLESFWGGTSPRWQLLEGNLFIFERQPDFVELYQRALASPAIEIYASEARLKTAEWQLAKTETKSNVSWQVGLRRFEETGDSAFTAGISIPLFSAKRGRGAIAVAAAGREEVEYERKRALLRLHSQLFEAYSQRQQHVNTIKVFQSTVIPELTSALKLTQGAYESGRYSYQDWIAAQQELLRAKHTLIESAASVSLNQAVIEQLVAEPLIVNKR